VEVHALDGLPDQVQLFVEGNPTQPVPFLVNQFTGSTSRLLRQRYPSLVTRLPSHWSRSYYAGTMGQVSEETVRQDIAAQQGV